MEFEVSVNNMWISDLLGQNYRFEVDSDSSIQFDTKRELKHPRGMIPVEARARLSKNGHLFETQYQQSCSFPKYDDPRQNKVTILFKNTFKINNKKGVTGLILYYNHNLDGNVSFTRIQACVGKLCQFCKHHAYPPINNEEWSIINSQYTCPSCSYTHCHLCGKHNDEIKMCRFCSVLVGLECGCGKSPTEGQYYCCNCHRC